MAKPRLGPDNLGTETEQLVRIRQLQEDVQEALDEELELFCIDECLFNSKGQKRSSWAPSGRPPEWSRRYYGKGYITVCGATSVTRGLVHHMMLENETFDAKSFMKFLRALHNLVRKTNRFGFAILMDNASIHGTEGGEVDTYCRANQITVIMNIKYRPDFNGIEGFWAAAKRRFRSRLDWLKANGLTWNLREMVEDVLTAIPKETAIRYTRLGFECIRAGKPVEPKRWREGTKHNLYLADLRALVRPNPLTRQQWENWERQRQEQLAAADTAEPSNLSGEEGDGEEGE